jgi:hypothetical protein
MGYGILSEPQVWEPSDYDSLGAYHTYVAEKIRERTGTQKYLFFAREDAVGDKDKDGVKFARRPDLEYKIIPRDPLGKVAYWSQIDSVPGADYRKTDGTPHRKGAANDEIKKMEEAVDCWEGRGSTGVCRNPSDLGSGTSCSSQTCTDRVAFDLPPIGIAAFSTDESHMCHSDLFDSGKAQEAMDAFACTFSLKGFPATYWSFGGLGQGEGRELVSSDGTLTKYGNRYKSSIQSFYPPFGSRPSSCPIVVMKAQIDEDTSTQGVQC